MTLSIHQPHDKFFKLSMNHPKIAHDFFAHHLPKPLLDSLDLSTLTLQKETFIDKHYRAYEADIIYQMKHKKRDALIYILCEHQNKPDKYLPLRMQHYIMQLLLHYHKKHPNAALPLIYPFLCYTGPAPYHHSLCFFDLFEQDKDLAKAYLQGPIHLIDVCRELDENIEKRKVWGPIESLFKYRECKNPDLRLEALRKIFCRLTQFEKIDRDFPKIMLSYVLNQYDDLDASRLFEQSERYLSNTLRGETMTVADQLRKEGMEAGRKAALQETMTVADQLRAEGRKAALQETMTAADQLRSEGVEAGKRFAAKRLLANHKLSIQEIAEFSGLSIETVRSLQKENEEANG